MNIDDLKSVIILDELASFLGKYAALVDARAAYALSLGGRASGDPKIEQHRVEVARLTPLVDKAWDAFAMARAVALDGPDDDDAEDAA
jgi:hypothetical protein